LHQVHARRISKEREVSNIIDLTGENSMADTAKLALWVMLEAKAGKEAEVEKFLRSGLAIVEREPGTTTWFAIRIGPKTFGIFDTFADESGRQAHLSGQVAAALKEKASELLSEPPRIEKVDVIAAKLPQAREKAA
jgi:quinol monooxygenase YgiN